MALITFVNHDFDKAGNVTDGCGGNSTHTTPLRVTWEAYKKGGGKVYLILPSLT